MDSNTRATGAVPFVEPEVERLTSPRLAWLDALRTLSAFAVVWLHVSAGVVDSYPRASLTDWWIGNIADASVRWAVPVFVMISGGLILPRAGGQSISEFYRRRILRLCVPLFFWSAAFVFYAGLQGGFSAKGILLGFLRGAPYYHLWFIFMLVGLYMAAPFLARLATSVSKRELWFMVLGGYLLLSLHEGLCTIRESVEHNDVFIQWIAYLPYFVAGYLMLSTSPFGKRRNWIILFLFSVAAISIGTGILLPILGAPRSWTVMYGYLNPFVAVSAFSVFQIFHSLNISEQLANILSKISIVTLGIYLVHPFWINVAYTWGLSPAAAAFGTPALGIFAISSFVFLLSFLTCVLIRLAPMGRRLVT